MSHRRGRRALQAALLCCACLGTAAGVHGQEPAAWQPGDASAVATAPVPERRLLPPGLLRYRVPEPARPFAVPYLAVGAGLLAADPYVIRAFRLDSLYLHEGGTASRQAHPIYRGVSHLGDPPLVAVLLVGLYALGGSRERDAARVGGVAYANALSLLLVGKYLTGKERPHASGGRLRYHGPNRRHTSFPSGHAAGTAALAHVLAHHYPESQLLWYGLSGAVGIARIGMAQHWPSDVWFGWGLGAVAAEGALAERARLAGWRPW